MIPLDTQINIIVQNLGSWLFPVMSLFSFMGIEHFMLIVIAIIYWCINTSLGSRLGLVLLATSSLNSLLKIGFHSPRPYWMDPNVIPYAAEPSFGFPSGHSQKAAVFWGMLGSYSRRPVAKIAAVFIILMIGISRLYLGVHYWSDVLAGWLIGFLILAIFMSLDRPISQWFSERPPFIAYLCAVAISVGLMAAGLFFKSNLSDWQIPNDWIQQSARIGAINPISVADLFSGCGVFLGFSGGLCWLRSKSTKWGKFNVEGTLSQKVWRSVAGIAGILFIWSGLSLVFPHDESVTGLIFRLIRYGLTGFWITGLAPFVFSKTGLVTSEFTFHVESTIAE
jgi:membrane-associated phospholipid phosphatase